MNEPRRWREEDDIPLEVSELLAAGRPSLALPAEVRQRSGRRVAALAALPVGIGALLFTPSTLAALGLGAAMGAAFNVATSVIYPVERAAAPVATSQLAAPSRPAARSIGSAVAPLAPRPRPAASSRGTDTLEDEARLLGGARALLASDPRRALALAHEHAQRFPKGQLALERAILEIDALRRLGRTSEARDRLHAVEGSARGTLYAPRVEHLASELGADNPYQ